MAGCSACDSEMVPYFWSASAQPRTAPGTETERMPEPGTAFIPLALKNAGVALLPARPLPLRATISPVFARRMSMKLSPPTPFMCGLTTVSSAAIVIAASTAVGRLPAPPETEAVRACEWSKGIEAYASSLGVGSTGRHRGLVDHPDSTFARRNHRGRIAAGGFRAGQNLSDDWALVRSRDEEHRASRAIQKWERRRDARYGRLN